MTRIPLTQGKTAIVDDDMAAQLSAYRWHAFQIGRCWYAATSVNGTRIYMHRMVMQVTGGDIDHINHDGLDNRKENLRWAERRGLNIANSRMPTGRSGYRGVTVKSGRFANHVNPFMAQIKVKGRNLKLGNFGTAEEAARAYDRAAQQHFGEFATLNFPER